MSLQNLVIGLVALAALTLGGIAYMDNAKQLGAASGTEHTNTEYFRNGLGYTNIVVAPVASSSVAIQNSGATYSQSAAAAGGLGLTLTLPPVKNKGAVYTFEVGAAFATDNFIIASAEGDNIEGTLVVAGAVVDCDGEDFVNFIADGENVGDFITLKSNGTNWILGATGGLTSAKITCTDPS